MTPGERDAYAKEVIRAVYGKDPEETFVSSADFHVLMRWMDDAVPLRVVLQAIGQMRKCSSLRHARPAVEEEWARWARAVKA